MSIYYNYIYYIYRYCLSHESFLYTDTLDYDIESDVFAEDINGFPIVTLTLQPEATEACFDVNIVDDEVFDGESESPVEQVTFSYSSSSPIVARVNLRHRLIILDNDRKILHSAKIIMHSITQNNS